VVKEIAFTVYPANDVAKLRQWYQTTLGLPFDQPLMEDGVEKFNQCKIGDGYFSVMTHEWMGRPAGSASGIVFEVDNLDDAIAQLRAQGLTVEDAYDTPVCRITSLEDPEGNKVSLHQITVPH
jgi:predicted enzyme related to lactoylglutathione lyase